MSKEKSVDSVDNFKSTADLTSNFGFQSSLSITSKNISDEKAYTPSEHRFLEHPNSVLGSIAHLLKACIGTGILAMPSAFKNSGLIIGTFGTILAGLLCTHTIRMLVKTSQELCVVAKKPSLSFAETCGAVFSYGPKKLQPWGGFVNTFVDYSLTVTYISVLCVYIVFIASSVKEVMDLYFPEYVLSIQVYCGLTFVPLVLLCQIRNLKTLVPFSMLANFLVIVVFGITMYYVFTDIPPLSERELVADVKQWPLFISTAIFAMEGIGVVMPVENEMKKPEKFLGCPGVLNFSMVVVVSLFTIFGFFGYVQYGDAVKGSVTLNLPDDDMVAQSAKLLMALVIFFSFALQFYIPVEMITRRLNNATNGPTRYNNIIQITIRTLIVTLTVGVAAAFPNLELVISLVGAVFFSTLGFLFPAIVETVYLWERGLGKFNYIAWKNGLIAIVSVIALVSGSYVSIIGLISHFSEPNEVHTNATLT